MAHPHFMKIDPAILSVTTASLSELVGIKSMTGMCHGYFLREVLVISDLTTHNRQ